MNAKEALIALNMIEHVGPIRVRQLLDYFGDPVAILKASRHRLAQVAGVGEEIAELIAQWEEKIDLTAELQRIREYGCRIITQDDELYPPLLRQIYDPPIVLYVKGELKESDRHSVAIVGSRLSSPYGSETARKFGYQLASRGMTVVSGGAKGIDTAAQQGALRAKGRTVTVLGTGINIVFPSENAALFERISETGALITQFPFYRKADRQTFPVRNRIVAGMSLGTLVVEANRQSGALITANMAVDYGRQVFAVPGRIDSPRSKGCHDLIKQGAQLCEGTEDIMGEFEYLFPQQAMTSFELESKTGDSNSIGGQVQPPLSEIEARVLDLVGHEQTTIDEVIHQAGLPTPKVSVALLNLERKGFVKQMPGKRFCRG